MSDVAPPVAAAIGPSPEPPDAPGVFPVAAALPSGLAAARGAALAAPAAFALLAAVLAAIAAVPPVEAAWASAAALIGFGASGWWDPAGWRRRAAEALLIPPAFALTLVADPTMRRMLVPPLLVLALLAAASSALARARSGERERRAVVIALALAARAATGLGLVGLGAGAALVAAGATALIAWSAARWRSTAAAIAAAALAGTLPFERHALLALTAALAAWASTLFGTALPRGGERVARGWLPAAAIAALLSASLAPWGGLGLGRALPQAGLLALLAVAGAAALSPLLPPAGAGAVWLLATLALGPLHPPPPDRAQVELTAAAPSLELPPGEDGLYIAEINLANAAALRQGTVVAFIEVGAGRVPVRLGVEAAEWAHERADVVGIVAHTLPERPVWRPTGIGGETVWAVSGQLSGPVGRGVKPVVRRQPSLPPSVVLSVATAGPSAPTPPRDWALPLWLLAAATAVALLQGVSGTWRAPGAWVPWAVLALGSLVARMPVEPLRLLGERHAVDLAMAALLAAWAPAARLWLVRGRVALAATALLVPLAAATPHLTPPVGDEGYHLLLLKSLRQDLDLDLANNYDVERHPENAIFVTPKGWFLHSPVLAMLLLPGYLVAGRAGAAVLLGVAAALAAALLARRVRALGVPGSRVTIVVVLMLLSYPLATYATQVWAEVPGILLAAVALTLAAASPPRPLLASAAAVLSAWIKTRLVLVTLPLAMAAWLPRRLALRSSRNVVLAAVLTATAAIALSIFWFGAALDTIPGRRQASHLVPRSLRQVLTSVGGQALDAAGGLGFSAPLMLVALAGLPLLWRRGGPADRALLMGGLLTLLSQLSNREWRGGDSPPARYLAVLLPMAALAGALLLQSARRWRSAASVLVPPTFVVWWVFLTRPHLGFNPGDGGFWLSDMLAARFAASALHMFPSFLRPSPATIAWPFIAAVLAAAVVWLSRRSPGAVRLAGRGAVSLLLLLGAGLVVALATRYDSIVELEDPQVVAYGGTLHPPLGQMSRFAFRNGWRLWNQAMVEVPLRTPGNAALALQGWLEGGAERGATLAAQWRGASPVHVPVKGSKDWVIALPPPPGPGKHWLRLTLIAPGGGSTVLDKIVVSR
jgi:hypothetical protein